MYVDEKNRCDGETDQENFERFCGENLSHPSLVQ